MSSRPAILSLVPFVPFAMAVALAGCAGHGAPTDTGAVDQPIVPGASSGGAASGNGSGNAALATTFAIPACAEPSGPVNTYTSVPDTQAKITGAWFLCSGGIYSPADTTGIVIEAAEARFLVTRDGALERGSGPEYGRRLGFVDATGMNGAGSYQINLDGPSGGNGYFSRTSSDGRFLELDEGTSGKRARYVRAQPAAPGCDTPMGAVHLYTSVADVSARLAGTWKICAGGINLPSDVRGLELTPALAYLLVADGAGLARRNTWDYERAVHVLDTSSMNGAGSYQINLSSGGRTNTYVSRVAESGARLELDEGTSGKKVALVRVSAAAAP